MTTLQTLLALLGLLSTFALYFRSPFFRARKSALLIYFFSFQVYLTGYFGSYDSSYPLWSLVLILFFIGGSCYAIYQEYRLYLQNRN